MVRFAPSLERPKMKFQIIETDEDRARDRADTLAAAAEILQQDIKENQLPLTTPGAVREYLKVALATLQHERFIALWLNSCNGLIEVETVSNGTINQTPVYTREVVRSAMRVNAAAVIFAHNHPSGAAQPSQADELLTSNLKEALSLIGVKVVDHFVVAGHAAISFAERGLL
jgi:DNA repair protein RadC